MAQTYVTQEGDNLTSIAELFYGDASLWQRIYEANKKTIGANPDLIQVGWTLTIPDAEEDAGAADQTYLTQAGDTLTSIAELFYGDGTLWPKIHEANKQVIGPDPNKLGVDLTLTIPA